MSDMNWTHTAVLADQAGTCYICEGRILKGDMIRLGSREHETSCVACHKDCAPNG